MASNIEISNNNLTETASVPQRLKLITHTHTTKLVKFSQTCCALLRWWPHCAPPRPMSTSASFRPEVPTRSLRDENNKSVRLKVEDTALRDSACLDTRWKEEGKKQAKTNDNKSLKKNKGRKEKDEKEHIVGCVAGWTVRWFGDPQWPFRSTIQHWNM